MLQIGVILIFIFDIDIKWDDITSFHQKNNLVIHVSDFDFYHLLNCYRGEPSHNYSIIRDFNLIMLINLLDEKYVLWVYTIYFLVKV